jgi:UDP-N-acetylmuramoyl-tripeptide--D-alanyl-D-alanine ligase
LENLLAAIATARAIGISWEGIDRGIREVKPAYHRGVIVPWRGATIYDDSYNSNPYALSRALVLLRQADVQGRRIAVIGDMLELGSMSADAHEEVGREAARSADVLVGVGELARTAVSAASRAGLRETHVVADGAEALVLLKRLQKPDDTILVKGSHSLALDRLADALVGADL